MSDASQTVVNTAANGASPNASARAKKATARKAPAKKKTSPEAAPAPVAGSRTARRAPAPAKLYKASLWPESAALPARLSRAVLNLQKELGLPVLLLLQDGDPDSPLDELNDDLIHMIRHQRDLLPAGRADCRHPEFPWRPGAVRVRPCAHHSPPLRWIYGCRTGRSHERCHATGPGRRRDPDGSGRFARASGCPDLRHGDGNVRLRAE